jgi:hypothetical protein
MFDHETVFFFFFFKSENKIKLEIIITTSIACSWRSSTLSSYVTSCLNCLESQNGRLLLIKSLHIFHEYCVCVCVYETMCLSHVSIQQQASKFCNTYLHIYICKKKKKKLEALRDMCGKFDTDEAMKVKSIEAVTNHDVKAVEYYIKDKFDQLGLSEQKEFIHFALTSQDINNIAIPLMLKESLSEVYIPTLKKLIQQLKLVAFEWDKQPMLARTHGQPATPTRMGKEMMVFVDR